MAIGRINATLTGVQPGGLAKIVPTSVAVGSGSGSVDSNGNVTFSGSTSVSLNGCFTSSYSNYRITFNLTDGAGSITLKLRASGTDTTSNYTTLTLYGQTATMYLSAVDALGTDEFYLFNMETSIDGSGTGYVDIFNPQLAYQTSITSNHVGASSGVLYWYSNYGRQNSTTQFDGFTILTTSTALTGTLRVYGYTN